MSSPRTPQGSCIVCGNNCHDTSTIESIEHSMGAMGLTPLQQKVNINTQSSDLICSLCVAPIMTEHENPQQCEIFTGRMEPPPSEDMPPTSEDPGEAESLWDTIIVNKIPVGVECKKLISVFSQYGTIKDTYLCHTVGECSNAHEKIVRITFSSEDEAWKVWEASQNERIKYDDHVLMITLASENYSPIENLPDECLERIFLHLYSIEDKFNVEKVCKRWNDVGRTSWSTIKSIATDELDLCMWRWILTRARHSVRNVSINPEKDGDKFLSAVAEKCERLKTLKCRLAKVNYQSCTLHTRALLQNNRNLRRLQLHFIDVNERDLDFMDVLSTRLEELDLRSADEDLILPVSTDLSRFSNLQVLILDSFDIKENQLRGIGNLNILKELRLDLCSIHDSNFEDGLRLTKLEKLSMQRIRVPDFIFGKILRNNNGLKYLNIKGARGITDTSFKFVQQLPQLQVLVIDMLDKITDKYLGGMPKIRGLSCNMCDLITDKGIQKLMDSAPSNMRRLRIGDCGSVTQQSIEAVREWTKRTGKSMIITVDCKLYWDYYTSGEQKGDKFRVIKGNFEKPDEFGDDGWGAKLVK